MTNEVAIIGMGCISAIGDSPAAMLAHLSAGTTGIAPVSILDPQFPFTPLAGEIKKTNQELVTLLGLDPTETYSRTLLLAFYAARQAVNGIQTQDLERGCLISANTVGGMDATESAYTHQHHTTDELLKHHDSGASTHFIAQKLGIHGFFTTISTACSSSANSIMMGARMILNGDTDLVIAGGADALCRFTLNGFNSLMLLSDEPCKPFDQSRKGLNLGEGAAYVVLCSTKLAAKYPVLGYLAGWGNANDAYHQTASSPDGRGARMAMEMALEVAGIQPNQVDYVNAHGTATPNNDLAESQALICVFGTPPPFSSTKSFTGHTLGASGSLEAVISLLALQNDRVFPSLNFHEVMTETGLQPVIRGYDHPVHYVLSNSFGFGGNCSSLVFKKQE